MTTTATPRFVFAAALAASLFSMTACEQPRWDDPTYITQQLEQGDASVKLVALGHIENLSDENKKAVVPALSKLYVDGDESAKKIMDMLVQSEFRDASAKDAYIQEVKSDASGKGGVAAETLGELQVKDAIPAMIELLDKTDSADVKLGILRGFTHMPDAQMIPPLLKLIALDVDNNPIALHSYSCDILGGIAQTTPQALDDKARQELVRAMFLANNKSQDVSFECGMAVQKLGQPAVPLLINVYKGEFKPVQRLMIAYNFPANRPKGVATTRMTTLRAKEAADLFIADISADEHPIPEAIAGNATKKAGYLQMIAQTLSEEILGLGDMEVAAAKDPLIAIMKGEKNEKWKTFMLDPAVQTQIRQDSAIALNRIGDRSALPAMFEMVKKLDANKELEKMAVFFESKKQPMDPTERYSFNLTTATAYANLATGAEKAEFVKWVGTLKDDKFKKELQKLIPAFDVQAECKDQAPCYAGKLASEDVVVREKAVYELMRLDAATVAPIFADKISTDKLNTRELLTAGLYKFPTKDAVAKLEALMEKEKDRGGADYRLDRRRLQFLLAYLKNNAK